MKTFNISITDNTTSQNTNIQKVSAAGLKKLLTKIITDNSPGVNLLFRNDKNKKVKVSKVYNSRNYLNEDAINLKPNNNE